MTKNSSSKKSTFSAGPSLIGYMYQVRYGLLDALRRTKNDNDFACQVEVLDDVQFQSGNTMELLQTKHHISRQANLTDASSDLWKSIRIWSDYLKSKNHYEGTIFYLVTTAKTPEPSAAAYLKAKDALSRQKALERLNSMANSSTNETNKSAYDSFKTLTRKQRELLVNSIVILDEQSNIEELTENLKKEAYWASEKRFLDSFITRLEGWWFARVVNMLIHKNTTPILSQEIYSEMTSLREQFKNDNLPIDRDIIEMTVNASGHEGRTFVKQLELIDIGSKRIMFAIKNYLRAATQRSRWIREELVMIGELDRYETVLKDEWELRFEQMKDELGQNVAEAAKQSAAKELYKYFETGVLPTIRSSCTEPFIARGTYHILADQLKIGWHPQYLEKLQTVISEERETV